ncbi:expressed unknown protein [Seminavis robusta]|uniref:Uncharacterized protein n=1 Tax=Seminavis robusta TaxID=568900 RepID=A0A9N8DZ61_9STRA|nr:expressed unknown protein [Seminavis robusta]|eukprot:Sro384_g131390.1 n/a (444) ;mRNA; f:8878-10209
MPSTANTNSHNVTGIRMFLRMGLAVLAMSLVILQQTERLVSSQLQTDLQIQIHNTTYSVTADLLDAPTTTRSSNRDDGDHTTTTSTTRRHHNAEIQDNNDRTAIVWVTRYLDICGAARLRHLIATSGAANSTTSTTGSSASASPLKIHPSQSPRDVWLLHNHNSLANHSSSDEQYQTSLQLLRELEDYARDEIGTRLYSAQQLSHPTKGFDDTRAGASKSSFLSFMVSHHYGWAWHIEDDVFYTGRWREIFGEEYHDGNTILDGSTNLPPPNQSNKSVVAVPTTTTPAYDVIATGKYVGPKWYWFQDDPQPCTIRIPERLSLGNNQQRCANVVANMTRWGIARLSGRFAHSLWTNVMTGNVVGHHEAVVASVCHSYNFTCTVEYLLQPRIGSFITAGWGDWAKDWKQRLTNHGTIKPSKIYHPVKCAAYRERNKKHLTQYLVY